MEPTLVDHLVVAVLVLVFPVLSVTDLRTLESRLSAGRTTARLGFYRVTMAWLWGLSVAVVALWLVRERALADLGLTPDAGTGFLVGLGLTVAACAVLIAQATMLRRDPDKARAAMAPFESVRAMMPRTDREAREFAALSITAGVCEELLYRGYLMLYVTAVVPIDGRWPAVLLSSLVFGLGHSYQGPAGVLKTGIFGLAMAGLYVLTGSIWMPVLAHAVLDLVSGSVARSGLAAAEPEHA